jgi:MFS family permease
VRGDHRLSRLVAAHVLAVVAEYAAVVGVLVYAFERGGSRATGLASIAVLAPQLAGAPLAARLVGRHRPKAVRDAGLAAQALGYAAAGAAAAAELPVAVAVCGAVVALTAVCTLRPTGAVLLPAEVRSTRELTLGNLWFSYGESAGALGGPLLAAALLAAGGPAAVLAACAAAVLAALACSGPFRGAGPPAPHAEAGAKRGLDVAFDVVRQRRWATGVLGVILARYVMLGALDVLLVVLAYDALDMDRNGAGVLNALVGIGAVASAALATLLARRRFARRLAPWLAMALAGCAVAFTVLGASTTRSVAFVLLPLVGLGAALVDVLGRILLQRAADPRQLGSLFALVELVGGVGLIVGSGLAQVLLAVGDESTALYGLAGALVLVLAASARTAWRADAGADVPVVAMSLLRELPMFAPASPLTLEAVARSATPVPVSAGEVVVTQGEPGDRFYAVARGRFDVVQSGRRIRIAERGSFFGEVALLADVPRTATVTALEDGELLAVDRVPFLIAVTGSDTSMEAAWGVVHSLDLDVELPVR